MSYSIRYPLSKKDKRNLLKTLEKELPSYVEIIKNAKSIEKAKLKSGVDIILIDGLPIFFIQEDRILPTLVLFYKFGKRNFPEVVVDKGAVPHILNGADVMRPGIVEIVGEFEKNDIVLVTEEEKGYPLAIGKALYNSNEILSMKKGKVIKNLHYLRDKLWRQLFKM